MLLVVTGCTDSGDERFRRFAQQALSEQAEQNKRLAEQSRQIAEASRRLVEGDAEARKDLLAAQRQLTSELHAERVSLDRQREEMEQERRTLAAQRHRAPIIAQAIGVLGVTLACLLPLLLAAYIIRAVSQNRDDSAALSELLIMEIAADEPLLLPAPKRVPALEHLPSPDEGEPAGPADSDAS
jgi:hypothetical protein